MIASALLLSVILVSVTVVAMSATRPRGNLQTSSSLVVSTVASKTNSTDLVVRLAFPNGTNPKVGALQAGSLQGRLLEGNYVFNNVTPGVYPLNFTGGPNIYFPSATVKVSAGVNSLNVTVYQLETFDILVGTGPLLNGSTPAPTIQVTNDTVVRFAIHNNTTLIQNLAIVGSLNNTEYSNVLFNSLSETISAGGSANDTFLVSNTGSYFYACLIGNDARLGEYGYFLVN